MAKKNKNKEIENEDFMPEEKKSSFSLLQFLKDERTRYITSLVLILFSVFLVFSFISYIFTWQEDQSKLSQSFFSYLFNADIDAENWAGKLGAYVSHILFHNTFGIASLSFVILLIALALRIVNVRWVSLSALIRHIIFITLWTSLFLGFWFEVQYFYLGGAYGYYLAKWFNAAIGKLGTLILLFTTAFAYVIIVFKRALPALKNMLHSMRKEPKLVIELDNINETDEQSTNDKEDVPAELVEEEILENNEQIENQDIEDTLVSKTDDSESNIFIKEIPSETEGDVSLIIERKSDEDKEPYQLSQELVEQFGEFDIRLDAPKYQFPSLDLLDDHNDDNNQVSEEELLANKNRIIETLKNYGIQINQIKATIGPTVTLYEIVPAPGVKISKIKNLEDDIALSLAALGIRIIAPIPGKGTIGIEVPNQNPQTVSMKSVIGSSKFQESKLELPVALGKNIQNEVFVFDLAKAPHLLVAGATGQGKSVGLNAIITSLLYKKHPSELKIVMIDPKKIELSDYAKIENHFLAKLPDEEEPIITDVQKVKNTLKSLTVEMDKRYDLLKEVGGIRTIKEYNEKLKKREISPAKYPYIPYIVVVVDEFADLIITAGREIEEPIARIAQLARAVGIHLIIATQRPSTNIITGSIKANFPTRIAFRVTSMIDSRTIIDTPGANQLIGRGDMLISMGSDMVRVQCAFVDAKEVSRIVDHISNQQAPANHFYLPQVADDTVFSSNLDAMDNGKMDDIFPDVARLIVSSQMGSTSLIQRKFSIGYARAGRIMDQLEEAKIVGPQEGSKARQVLIQDLNYLEQILKDLGF
ncbi:MAG TPA: DNA translocase FtsK [Bacteroidales bacterium]|nr:DNA translocase FtsK [Bacteroidales bacterium]